MKHKPTFPVGTRVTVRINGETVEGQYAGWNDRYNLPNVTVNGKPMIRKIYGVVESRPQVQVTEPADVAAAASATVADDGVITTAVVPHTAPRFTVAQRFDFVNRLLNMVVEGQSNGLIISGSGGLGKSYTVFEQMNAIGMKKDEDFQLIKGFSTPKAMYRALHTFKDGVIIFDDCDSVLDNMLARNILKGALDSYDARWISWKTERDDPDLPDEFEFKGKVIFISNKSINEFDQPILSRTLYVDLTMTTAEKLERMQQVLANLKPNVSIAIKQECLGLITEVADLCTDLNFRTLLKVIDIRLAHPNHWRDLATYTIVT